MTYDPTNILIVLVNSYSSKTEKKVICSRYLLKFVHKGSVLTLFAV